MKRRRGSHAPSAYDEESRDRSSGRTRQRRHSGVQERSRDRIARSRSPRRSRARSPSGSRDSKGFWQERPSDDSMNRFYRGSRSLTHSTRSRDGRERSRSPHRSRVRSPSGSRDSKGFWQEERPRDDFRDRSYRGSRSLTQSRRSRDGSHYSSSVGNSFQKSRIKSDRSDTRRKVVLGFNAVSNLLTKEPDDVVVDLTTERCFPAVKELLSSEGMETKMFFIVLKMLAHLCKTTSAPSGLTVKLLNFVLQSKFISHHLSSYLNAQCDENEINDNGLEALQNIAVLFSELLSRFPSSYAKLPIPALKEYTASLDDKQKLSNNHKTVTAVEELVAFKNKQVQNLKKNAQSSKQPTNETYSAYRQMSVIPSQDDFCTTSRPFLRKNKTVGAYSGPDDYLDAQFRLMREDFIRPLRQGIQELLGQDESTKLNSTQDIRLYHNVRVLDPVFSYQGISYKVEFDMSRLKRVNWKNCKRLIYGSLLCLSMDNFKSSMLATVEKRDVHELEKGIVHIRFNQAVGDISANVYTMVETVAYFESYRHVLQRLQEIDPQSMPFQKYIVYCENVIEPPAYLRSSKGAKAEEEEEEEEGLIKDESECEIKKITYDLTPIMEDERVRRKRKFDNAAGTKDVFGESVDILDLNSWPSAEALNLDESQLRAVQTALTKEFSVIQGPPGTGKTYIGLKVAKVLLHNKSKWDSGNDGDDNVQGEQLQNLRQINRHRPILVVCYTNHALDQFLEGIHEFRPNGIVRVGGRSASEKLEKCILKNLRRENPVPIPQVSAMQKVKGKLRDMEQKLNGATENRRICMDHVIHEKELVYHGEMSRDQMKCLTRRRENSLVSAMLFWLELIQPNSDRPVHRVASFPFSRMSAGRNFVCRDHKARFSHARIEGPGDGWLELRGSAESFVEIPSRAFLDVRRSITLVVFVFPKTEDRGKIVWYGNKDRKGVAVEQHGTKRNKGVLVASFPSRDSKGEGSDYFPSQNCTLSSPVLRLYEWNYVVASYNYESGLAQLWHDGTLVSERLIGEHRLLATQYSLRVGPVRGRLKKLYIFPEAIGTDQIWQIGGITQGVLDARAEENDDFTLENDGMLEEPMRPASCRSAPHALRSEDGDFTFEADALMAGRMLDDGDDYDNPILEQRHWSEKRIQTVYPFDIIPPQENRTHKVKARDKSSRARGIQSRWNETLKRELRSKDVMTEQEVEAAKGRDLWELPLADRWRLYRYWSRNIRVAFREVAEDMNAQDLYRDRIKRLNELKEMQDIAILRKAEVIGMTTTGAAKNHEFLQEIKPRVVIVEEAAEVMEAHIVTALSPACQHLILIGDHKQLRPNTNVFKLARDFKLDVSLFERMVNNKIPLVCLRKQHRMRPEISKMLHHIYPDLEDHESVLNFDNIKGVSTNIFFIDHQEKEELIEEGRSRSNIHEAKYVAALCRYLILQGYERSKITVLTMYTGQLLALRKEMPKDFFEGVRVSAVDNFQGEENDIILLSLVRSNDEGNIGFLNISNRVCVALSRARKGFYCIGNLSLMGEVDDLWRNIVGEFHDKGKVGKSLRLACQNHPDKVIRAAEADNFKDAPEGGCMLPCAERLACGHMCEKPCHPVDNDHTEFKCRKPCRRQLCDLNHPCPLPCFEECKPCTELLPKIIPECQHEQQVPCHIDPWEFKCSEPCPKTLECGHPCARKCGDTCTSKCIEKIEKTLPCGHKETVRCYKDIYEVKCLEPCKDLLKCEHQCEGTCHSCMQGRVHQQCKSKCGRTLFCGHICQEPCTKNCPPCKEGCQNKCTHSECKKKCGEPCVPCAEPCAWKCRHYKCSKLCGEICDRPRCDKPCPYKIEKCKHPCIGLCGEKCPEKCRICDKDEVTAILFGDEDEPDARFVQLEDCIHIVEVKGMDKWMDQAQDGDASFVQLKGCPKCTAPIRNTRRYGNIVKGILKDFENIKEKMILTSDAETIDKAIEITLSLTRTDIHILPWSIKDLKSPRMTANQLNVYNNQTNFLKRMLELQSALGAEVSSDPQVMRQIDALKATICRKRTFFNVQELEDIDKEIHRLELWRFLLVLRSNLNKREKSLSDEHADWISIVDNALDSGGRLDQSDIEMHMDHLEEIRKEYFPDVFYGSVTKDEKTEIVKAVGLTKGHWYKCPNGHFYCIGECGGAMQESTCPECGAAIGGSRHRLLEDNSLAPEMDGAEHAAYGDMANMNNFDLADLQ
ncbi:NFX1-type zinc finger-containing protein 1-like isoform X2 [Nematostella vectensis]|uniref:NFX1-type zinc finger-containing protein 1-like isoform X2 n=1 Tax=Nematostella vectensis TaxID=45351 RepID=UPI002076DA8D|nr:NFX1-type zinc finger-containing protein 1-like isoform X2 [Nematostella vectensis]